MNGKPLKVLRDKLQEYPGPLIAALSRLDHGCGGLYLTGGTVRDWFLGRSSADIDLVVSSGAETCCREVLSGLGRGVLVPLGEPENDTARLVWQGMTVDITGFRGGSTKIEDDLRLRDFTVNAMAVPLRDLLDKVNEPVLIDPTGGYQDLERETLRACDYAFVNDPLRILRAFRFMATLGFRFHPSVQEAIRSYASLIIRPAVERVRYELDLIMNSKRAGHAFTAMAETGVLWHIIPELQSGLGVVQPGFHHLDVFSHSLETLVCMENIFREPNRFYPKNREVFIDYISRENVRLKWAALLHDVGKPATMDVHPEEQGRTTFYNHDKIGGEIFLKISGRLRWSNAAKATVGRLIELHMYPFHLCNASRTSPISKKACLKIWKKADSDLPGLFLLAMADSLACRGEKKPKGMEEELASLFDALKMIIDQSVTPVISRPRFVTGDDLIEIFHLSPGPAFSRILSKLEGAAVEGEVGNRQEALDWIENYLQNRKI